MSLWLVRHAAPDWPDGLALGHADPPLSGVGQRQAAILARAFARIPLEAVVSSDLRRSQQTATHIASRHQVEVQIWPELREVDFGGWEGRRLGSLWIEEPESARRWEVDPTDFPQSFGESFEALRDRVQVVADRLSQMCPAPTLVVGHGGTLRLLRAILTGAPPRLAWSQAMPVAASVQIEWSSLFRLHPGARRG